MAIQVSGTDVINQNRELVNVNAISGGVVATEAEAEAGTNTNKVITPATLKAAIEAMTATAPDIPNEGWPGTHKGVAGYGISAYNPVDIGIAIMSKSSFLDLSMSQDTIIRNLDSWDNNRVNKTAQQSMQRVLPIIYNNTNSPNMYMDLLFPSKVSGKTMDLYFYINTSNYTYETAFDTIPYVVASGSLDTVPANLTRQKEFVYFPAPYGADGTLRLRFPNLPDIASVKIYGINNTTFGSYSTSLAYYEIY